MLHFYFQIELSVKELKILLDAEALVACGSVS